MCDDFLDFTKTRPHTFYDGDHHVAKHIAMEAPYDSELNDAFEAAYGEKLPRGVYVTTEGPRFESRAEIKFYASIGGDVVGMTNVPEVVLARELGLHYANICHVINYCTGVEDTMVISKSKRRGTTSSTPWTPSLLPIAGRERRASISYNVTRIMVHEKTDGRSFRSRRRLFLSRHVDGIFAVVFFKVYDDFSDWAVGTFLPIKSPRMGSSL